VLAGRSILVTVLTFIIGTKELAGVELPVTTGTFDPQPCVLGVTRRGDGGWATDVCGRVARRRHSR
jgi:hypothetical protein